MRHCLSKLSRSGPFVQVLHQRIRGGGSNTSLISLMQGGWGVQDVEKPADVILERSLIPDALSNKWILSFIGRNIHSWQRVGNAHGSSSSVLLWISEYLLGKLRKRPDVSMNTLSKMEQYTHGFSMIFSTSSVDIPWNDYNEKFLCPWLFFVWGFFPSS